MNPAFKTFHFSSKSAGAQQPVNSYLLCTPRGIVLIDPAADLSPRDLPFAPDAILVTHLQNEHVAGALNFPDVPLYIPAGDEYLCKGRTAYQKVITAWLPPWDWETRGNFRGHLAGAPNERPTLQPLPIAGVLRAGEEIFGLQILATPGHGKNALTFLAQTEDQKIAWCGDVIFEAGKLWNWFDCDWDYGAQAGQHALLESARRLQNQKCDILFASHGAPVNDPDRALSTLVARLQTILREEPYDSTPLNFPEKNSPAQGIGAGWREVLPNLHQWRDGNCAALVSQSGHALLIDDGLCFWQGEPQRSTHHREVIGDLKAALGIEKIEWCIPTHYHGDHIENIPQLVEEEGAQVLCLDTVADAIENAREIGLAAALWWYGTAHDTIPIHRRVPCKTRFAWREYELEIFHLGGQTYYHAGIEVQISGRKVLFCGDAIYGWNTAPEAVLCFNDCEPQARGWLYAIEKMIDRSPDVLVCGHGSALQNPMPLLLEKRARWMERLAEYSALDARQDLQLFFDPFTP